MNWSDELVELVPSAEVTVMSTTPALPAGEIAVIEVQLLTVKELALVAPNFTAVGLMKLLPVMLTLVPPAVEPLEGEMPNTVGGPAARLIRNVYRTFVDPSCAVTVMKLTLVAPATRSTSNGEALADPILAVGSCVVGVTVRDNVSYDTDTS